MKKLLILISASMLTVSAFSDTLMRQIPTTSAFWRTTLTNETPLQAAEALGIFGTNYVPVGIVTPTGTVSQVHLTNSLIVSPQITVLGLPSEGIKIFDTTFDSAISLTGADSNQVDLVYMLQPDNTYTNQGSGFYIITTAFHSGFSQTKTYKLRGSGVGKGGGSDLFTFSISGAYPGTLPPPEGVWVNGAWGGQSPTSSAKFSLSAYEDGFGNAVLTYDLTGSYVKFNKNGDVDIFSSSSNVTGVNFSTTATTSTNPPSSLSTNTLLWIDANGAFNTVSNAGGFTFTGGTLLINAQTNGTLVLTNDARPLKFTNAASIYSGTFTGAFIGNITGSLVVTGSVSIPTNIASMPAVLNPIVANILYTNAPQRSFLDVNYLLSGTNAGLYFNNLTTTYSEFMTNNMVVGTNAVITDKRSFHYFTVLGPSDVVLFSNLSGCTILSSQRR